MSTKQKTSQPVVGLVPVDTVRFHPRNIRRDLGDLRELEASIRAEGILQPLLMHRKAGGLEVVDGHRRLAASRLAGLRRVPAVVVDELDDDEAMTKMLATTLRKGISAEERRDTLWTLRREFGYTATGLAERYGVSVSTIHLWCADDSELGKRRNRSRQRNDRRVYGSHIDRVADAWQERAAQGLTPGEALSLLAELRALGSTPGSVAS